MLWSVVVTKRYEREIEEILHQDNVKAIPEKRGFFDRVFVRSSGSDTRRNTRRLTGPQFFLGSISLLLVAILLNSLGIGFAWVGLILFVASYFMFFTQSSKLIEKRWRGQVLDDSTGSESFLRRILKWFGRK